MAADLDLVSITTQPSLHHPMALAALAAGRHVLCEKPMAMSTREAEDMLAHGDQAKRVHVIDHELRFNPNRRKVRRLIDEGFIGVPRHALLTIVNSGRHDPAKPWGWWYDETQGGGLLGAVGSAPGGPPALLARRDRRRHRHHRRVRPGAGRARRPRPAPGDRRRLRVLLHALPLRSGRHGGAQLRRHARGRAARRGLGRRRLPRPRRRGPALGREARRAARGADRGGDTPHAARACSTSRSGACPSSAWWTTSSRRRSTARRVAPAATFRDGVAVQKVLDAVRQSARSGWVSV